MIKVRAALKGRFLLGASIKRDSGKTVGRRNAVPGIGDRFQCSPSKLGNVLSGFEVKDRKNVKHIR